MSLFGNKSSEKASNRGVKSDYFEGPAELICAVVSSPARTDRNNKAMVPVALKVLAVKRGPAYKVGESRSFVYKTEGGEYQESDDAKWFSFIGSALGIRLGELSKTIEDVPGLKIGDYDLNTKKGKAAAQDDIDEYLRSESEKAVAGEGNYLTGKIVVVTCRLNKKGTFTKQFFEPLPEAAFAEDNGVIDRTKLSGEFVEYLTSEGYTFENGAAGRAYGHGEDRDDD